VAGELVEGAVVAAVHECAVAGAVAVAEGFAGDNGAEEVAVVADVLREGLVSLDIVLTLGEELT